jgi:hypothetical protein
MQFEALLAQKEIPKRLHSEYLKWVRYHTSKGHNYRFFAGNEHQWQRCSDLQ